MRLLFDENISYRIVKQVVGTFSESLHVSRIGVSFPISDRIIWEYAKKMIASLSLLTKTLNHWLTYMDFLPRSLF